MNRGDSATEFRSQQPLVLSKSKLNSVVQHWIATHHNLQPQRNYRKEFDTELRLMDAKIKNTILVSSKSFETLPAFPSLQKPNE